jgi:hypothetical protein
MSLRGEEKGGRGEREKERKAEATTYLLFM